MKKKKIAGLILLSTLIAPAAFAAPTDSTADFSVERTKVINQLQGQIDHLQSVLDCIKRYQTKDEIMTNCAIKQNRP